MVKPRILVVEDEMIASEHLQNILINLGYEIAGIACKGKEAIEKAGALKPDLVLMDVALAGEMTGIEAAQTIKDRLDIPVIYVTGNADIDLVIHARKTNPYGYVIKPVSIVDLYSSIDTALQRHQLQKKLRESEARYRSLVESTSDWVWEVDPEWHYTYSSPKVKDILGFEPYEVIGKSVIHFMPQVEKERTDDIRRDILESRKPFYGLENINVHKNGTHVVLETSGIPYFDAEGNYLGYRGIDRVITERKRSEKALRENEERFRALVQNVQDIIIIMNAEGTITFENPVVEDMLGYSLLGRNYFEYVHPDDIAMASHDFEEVVKKVNPNKPTAIRAKHADGSWVYLEVLAINLFENTAIQGGLFVCRNVTERMKAQASLQESEERYRALFNQSPVGVLLFGTGLIVTDCSERLAAIMKTTRDRIIGQDLSLIIQEAGLILKFRDTINGSVSYYEGPYQFVINNLFLYVVLEASPLRDAGGKVVGGIAVIQDMTDKKIAEARLKASEERTRLVVENANEGIIIIKDGRLSFANGKFKELVAYSYEELAYKFFIDFFHPDDRGAVAARLRERREGDVEPAACEVRLLGKNNAVTWIDFNTVLFSWEGGPASLCFLRDITMRKWADEERKNIEAQIQQAQKLESLGVLAGGIAHDFNNLLMAILGNLDLSLLDIGPGTASRPYLLEAVKASQRAADLCRQMLAYSGRGQFVSEALNINDIVKDMGHMLEISVSKKALLRYHLPSDMPSIEADATQVRQIIMNLVINASDAINEKSGVITLATGAMQCDHQYFSETWLNEKLPDGLYVYLEVSDTGIGMDRDTMAKIFDPFFTTKFTGRGLGLAAVLGIVRGHKGAIKVSSEENRGTTFKILFPAAAVAAEPREAGGAAEVALQGRGTILFADDEETIRTLGKKMLEHWGYTVLLAADGREAVDIFQKNADEISCIILDLTMPRMDGEETFHALRKIKRDVRVIMSSGYSEQEINQRFTGKKLAGFIQKPYQMTELSAKLKQVLG